MKHDRENGFSILEATILLLFIVTLIVAVASLWNNLTLKTTASQYLMAEQLGLVVEAALQVSGSGVEIIYPKISEQLNQYKQNSLNRVTKKLNISASKIKIHMQLRGVSVNGDKLIFSEGVPGNLDGLWKDVRAEKIELYKQLNTALSQHNLPEDRSDLYLLVELVLPTNDKKVNTEGPVLRVQQIFLLRQRWQWL